MPYNKTNWINRPSTSTPLNATNLNKLETQYDQAIADSKAYTDGKDTSARAYTDTSFSSARAYSDAKLVESKTYTDGKVGALTKSSIGLPNVDNTSDATQPDLVRGEGGRSYRFIAGTLRYVNATTWAMIDDAGHRPTGVSSVEYFTNKIRVNFNFTASKVVTFIATPDETIAVVPGIRMGPSVGTSYADIFIYTTAGGATPINPSTLSNASGNLWIYGVMEV